MPSNVQDQTSKATPLKFVNGLVIPPSFYNGCNYLSVLGFKSIHVSLRGILATFDTQLLALDQPAIPTKTSCIMSPEFGFRSQISENE